VSVTFLTPVAGAAAAGALLPVAGSVLGGRRVARVREVLRLPPLRADRVSAGLGASAVALLALAATQPALSRTASARVRTDAAVWVVLDVSRSMDASAAPDAPTRLDRARDAAVRIRAGLGGVPVGLAVMTDRVVPLLFPTGDEAVFTAAVHQAVRSEVPPPLELAPTATTFDSLGALGTQGYFTTAQRHRSVVVLTDAESEPFDPAAVAAGLGDASLLLVRFWSAAERVYDGTRPEAAYRPDPTSSALARQLADATGGRVVSAGGAAGAVRNELGSGRTAPAPGEPRRTPLAPWVALASALPLAALLRRRLLVAL
jgi:VWA domain-containing protein